MNKTEEAGKRNIILKFRVNEIENEVVKARFSKSECASLSDYLRRLAMYGLIIFHDRKKRGREQNDVG